LSLASWADAIIYHELPLTVLQRWRLASLGREKMRKDGLAAFSSRRDFTAPPGALDRVDELVEKHKVNGIKLYPHDMVAGELRIVPRRRMSNCCSRFREGS